MNKDLEEQLKEMSTDYQVVVNRLRAARTVEPCTRGLGRRSTVKWLIAASLLVVLCLSITFKTSQTLQTSQTCSYGAREYRQSVPEIIASQSPDGSWQNDFLTRHNAEVLAKCEGSAARIAYKKAIRNLRAKGLL